MQLIDRLIKITVYVFNCKYIREFTVQLGCHSLHGAKEIFWYNEAEEMIHFNFVSVSLL